MLGMMVAAALAAAGPVETPLTAPGPQGPLAGTLTDAGKGAPVVLILPGSGPTNRDGNNPMGVSAQPYRLLAEALAIRGVSTLRIDKRGLFGSKGAVADPSAVTIADYAADAQAWIAAARARTGAKCIWLLGHSEGGLIALQAAQPPAAGVCGLMVVSAAGRPMGEVIRAQLHANPANAALLPAADAAIDALEAGRRVDTSAMPAPLMPLFYPGVQGFLINSFALDPAKLAAKIIVPVLIVQGDQDIQIGVADARALAAAQPRARLMMVPGMNHVLKMVASGDRAANLAAYADPSLPLAPALVEAVVSFVKGG